MSKVGLPSLTLRIKCKFNIFFLKSLYSPRQAANPPFCFHSAGLAFTAVRRGCDSTPVTYQLPCLQSYLVRSLYIALGWFPKPQNPVSEYDGTLPVEFEKFPH
ncbi:hypothetical protein H5410_043764 [Solanum commersonii]|uniref:Uncharacterized protein n=1 Tax=Solanum commersonii TaxID=4109 RepID=A0A9J5XZT6_SOLCO|nr:hypothetical protein H5410_043764 [Solanum commersonii]